MATSAARMAAEATAVADYNDETDTEEETFTPNTNTNTNSNTNFGVVIKLEPESDPEDSYHTVQFSIQDSTTSHMRNVTDNDSDGEAHRYSDNKTSHQSSTNITKLTSKVDVSFKIKQEKDWDHSDTEMLPKWMNGYVPNDGPWEEDYESQQNIVHHLTHSVAVANDLKASSVKSDVDGGLAHSADYAVKSTVNRRKLSSVSRRGPIPLRKRRKKVNVECTESHTGSSAAPDKTLLALSQDITSREDGEMAALFPGSLSAAQTYDQPGVKPVRQRRRRTKKQELLICTECGLTFRWPSRYNEHIRRHSGERPFICRECGDAFTSSSYLRVHERKHNGLLPYPCTICGAAFMHGRLLTEHRKCHADEGAFTCEDCGLKCGSPNELSRHRQTVHPDNPSNKPFVCHLCPAAFLRSYHLETHMRSHTGEKPFKCELCGLAYTTQGSLKVHTRSHTGERPFICTECDRGFITSGQLKKHSRTHNKPIVTVSEDNKTVYVQTLKPVTQVREEEGARDSATLKLEIQCFPKDSTYSCDICEEVFVRSIDLASHMRHDHPLPVKKENMCRECGQVFSRAHTLKVHLRTHSGIKPFKCNTCDKGFAQRSNLNAHLRTHSQYKPFKCSICGVSYSSAKYRETHMLSHGEIRPCECIVCGSTFSSNALLSTHVRSHDHSEIAAAFAVSAAVRASTDIQFPESTLMQNTDLADGDCDHSSGKTLSPDPVIYELEEADTKEQPEESDAAQEGEGCAGDTLGNKSTEDGRTAGSKDVSQGQCKEDLEDGAGKENDQSVGELLAATEDCDQVFKVTCSTAEQDNELEEGMKQDCETWKRMEEDDETEERTEDDDETEERIEEDGETDKRTEEDSETEERTEEDDETEERTEEDDETEERAEDDDETEERRRW